MEIKNNPGDFVSGYAYPNNAIIENDFLYLRDENGNIIDGKVTVGDRITVLKVVEEKRLALVQYPVGTRVRQGYVTNSSNIIKYFNQYKWVNKGTRTDVYSNKACTDQYRIGSVDGGERATLLYKDYGLDYIVYDTSVGINAKSGFVKYDGSGAGGGSTDNGELPWPNVTPGELVPGRTFDANATVINDFLYLRDANGNTIPGRTVSIGDEITVLDVGYSRQLALVQYPTNDGIRQGYVTNATNLISYKNPYTWVNRNVVEAVHSTPIKNDELGTINPYEAATILYKTGGRYHVVYNTSKGFHTKSGFVDFDGTGKLEDTSIRIPAPAMPAKVEKMQYGSSGKGRPLNVYKIGSGSKVLFAGFAIHGYEDIWDNDGIELVYIGNEMVKRIGDKNNSEGLNGWTVYIAPCMNPDGVIVDGTNNGPGRCAVTSRVDLNRCFPYGFTPQMDTRTFTGPNPLGAVEAVHLKNFIERLHRESSYLAVVDAHGWLNFTQGNHTLGQHFGKEFGFGHNSGYSGGFFSSWANSLSHTDGVLLEYPEISSHSDAVNRDLAGKTYRGLMRIIGSSTGGGGNPDAGNGQIIVGSKVKVIGTHWQTGEPIPNWVKDEEYIVERIDKEKNRALLADIRSWAHLKDLVLISGGGNPDTGNGDVAYNARGEVINVTSTLNVRSGPSTSHSVVGTLKGGAIVEIIAKNNGWYKISAPITGYVYSNYIQILDDSVDMFERYRSFGLASIEGLKIRKLPSQQGDVIATLSKNSFVNIIGQNKEWYEINEPMNGYILKEHVKLPSLKLEGETTEEAIERAADEVFTHAYGLTRDFSSEKPLYRKQLYVPKMGPLPAFYITIESSYTTYITMHPSPDGAPMVYHGSKDVQFGIPGSGPFEFVANRQKRTLALALGLFEGHLYIKLLNDTTIKMENYLIIDDMAASLDTTVNFRIDRSSSPTDHPMLTALKAANNNAMTTGEFITEAIFTGIFLVACGAAIVKLYPYIAGATTKPIPVAPEKVEKIVIDINKGIRYMNDAVEELKDAAF